MPSFEIEQSFASQGFTAICGVDEVGRGPLVGDVYAAAVILPQDADITALDDSKKLTAKKRTELYHYIVEIATSYAIAKATPQEIDELNIRNAAFLAMCRAVEQLFPPADFALIDGNAYGESGIPFECIVKGDSKSASISAASILAKVARDQSMLELDSRHPEYGFARHKGYPTKEHYAAIQKHGILPEHRRSFRLE